MKKFKEYFLYRQRIEKWSLFDPLTRQEKCTACLTELSSLLMLYRMRGLLTCLVWTACYYLLLSVYLTANCLGRYVKIWHHTSFYNLIFSYYCLIYHFFCIFWTFSYAITLCVTQVCSCSCNAVDPLAFWSGIRIQLLILIWIRSRARDGDSDSYPSPFLLSFLYALV